MAFDAGDVLLVPFPFRDRQGEKTRPAVMVSGAAYNRQADLIIAAITSQSPRFASDYALVDWSAAGLKLPSTVRMLIATIAASRVQHRIGRLSDLDRIEVRPRLLDVLVWP